MGNISIMLQTNKTNATILGTRHYFFEGHTMIKAFPGLSVEKVQWFSLLALLFPVSAGFTRIQISMDLTPSQESSFTGLNVTFFLLFLDLYSGI